MRNSFKAFPICIISLLAYAGCDLTDNKTPALRLTEPINGASFDKSSDLDPSRAGVQLNVSGNSDVIGYGEQVELWVDNSFVTSTLPQFGGPLFFPKITFSEGTHQLQLKARNGKVVSALPHNITIRSNVQPNAPSVTITSPSAGSTVGANTADCNPNRAGHQIAITATTDAADGSSAVAKIGSAETSPAASVSGGTVTLCATAVEGTNVPIEVKVTDATRGTGTASHAITIILTSATAPTVSITFPTEGTTFTEGSTDCDTNLQGLQIGITVATDAADGSTAVAKVGSAAASPSATVAANAVTLCASVEEGLNVPVEVTVTDATRGAGSATTLINVVFASANAPTVAITSPAAGATVGPATGDCNPAVNGLQIEVKVSTDAADGSAALVKIGNAASSDVGIVSAGAVTLCASVAEGTNVPVVATVTDPQRGPGVGTININVVFPTLNTPVASLQVDSIENNRTWRIRFKWPLVADSQGTVLSRYVLHCDDPRGSSAAGPINTEAKWLSAETKLEVTQTGTLTAGAMTTATFDLSDLRMQDTRRCLVRGRDAANALTPLANTDASINVVADFNAIEIPVPAGSRRFGYSMAPVGDVNGDGRTDFLVGSDGSGAYLYFGRSTWGTNVQPDVHFTATSTFSSLDADCVFGADGGGYGLGFVVTGIGDFNGDGVGDFAISDIGYPNCTFNGMVYLVYGRSSNDWPSSINLAPSSCVTAATCCGGGVGLCFYGADAGMVFGYSLSTAGNFDGANDTFELAVGATQVGSSTGRVIVLRNSSSYATGTAVAVSESAATNQAEGFAIQTSLTDNATQLGFSMAWAFNASGFPVLAVGAQGPNAAQQGRAFSVSGQAYVGPELDVINAVSEIDVGRGGELGTFVANFGNFTGGANNDIGVYKVSEVNNTSTARIYFANGSGGFTPGPTGGIESTCAAGVCLDIIGAPNLGNAGMVGITMGNAVHPAFGLLGDLDKDTYTEGLFGVQSWEDPNPSRRDRGGAQIIYGNPSWRTVTSANTYPVRYQYMVPESHTSNIVDSKTVEYLGDTNADGFADFAVGSYINVYPIPVGVDPATFRLRLYQ